MYKQTNKNNKGVFMRCTCCQTILTTGELMFDLPDGSMNDICWTCQGVIDHPESCETDTYQFEDITELLVTEVVTPPKPLND